MDVSKIHGVNLQTTVEGPHQAKGADRSRSASGDPEVRVPRPDSGDVASIQSSGVEFRATVDALVERAKQSPGNERESIVAAARERLESGALDRHGVHEAVAQRILADE